MERVDTLWHTQADERDGASSELRLAVVVSACHFAALATVLGFCVWERDAPVVALETTTVLIASGSVPSTSQQ